MKMDGNSFALECHLLTNLPIGCCIEDGKVEFAPIKYFVDAGRAPNGMSMNPVIAMTGSVLPAASYGKSINGHSIEWVGGQWS